VAIGCLLPVLLLLVGSAALAGLAALGGLLVFEWCFIMAGQSVPNS
jgi:hypothetical protein